MNVLGIDLSLTGTGLAVLSDKADFEPRTPRRYDGHASYYADLPKGSCRHFNAWLVAPPKSASRIVRWDEILSAVLGVAAVCDQIMIEGYAFGAQSAYARAIAEIGGIVRYHLEKIGKPPIEVAPSVLKKFITGHGGADKNVVIKEVLRRYSLDVDNDNIADAFGLAMMGSSLNDTQSLTAWQAELIDNLKNPKPKKKGAK